MPESTYLFRSYATYLNGEPFDLKPNDSGFLRQDVAEPYQEMLSIFVEGDPIRIPTGDGNYFIGTFMGSVNFADGTSDGRADNGAFPVVNLTYPPTDGVSLVYSPDPNYAFPDDLGNVFSGDFFGCFGEDTGISTPDGERPVQDLAPGDLVLTAEGREVPVLWLGRRQLSRSFSGTAPAMVRIRAGALGKAVPHSDLLLTGDHGVLLDGVIATASALVGGAGIDFVPLSELPAIYTVYHIETADHCAILANGTPAETIVPGASRTDFDNHAEFAAQYSDERIVPEMPLPRIASARLLPPTLCARLGMKDERLAMTA